MDDELRIRFSRNLNNLLSLNGYTQADLSRHMGISTASVANWCTGKSMPRIDKIQKIATWLGVKRSDLLDDKQVPIEPTYYLNDDTRKVAQIAFDNPEIRILCDAARNVSADDMQILIGMARRMSKDFE